MAAKSVSEYTVSDDTHFAPQESWLAQTGRSLMRPKTARPKDRTQYDYGHTLDGHSSSGMLT
jgi:hypothetical protein